MKRWLAVFSVLVASATVASAASVAPMPPHFVNEVSRGENEFYRPIPNRRGIYACGVAGRSWRPERDGAPCLGSEAEQQKLIASFADGSPTEFWFYATRAQGILFSRSLKLDPKRSCAAPPEYDYELERAYVADGFIHSMKVDDNNAMEPLGSWPVDHSAGEYSGSFMRLHSLMARPAPDERDRVQGAQRIAGIRSDCRGFSGLVWHSVCAAASGPATGMILSASAGDDEQIMFNTEIKELRADILLPGVLFETDRTWTGRD